MVPIVPEENRRDTMGTIKCADPDYIKIAKDPLGLRKTNLLIPIKTRVRFRQKNRLFKNGLCAI